MTITERWKRIQREIGAVPDGQPGVETIGKLEQRLEIGSIGAPAILPIAAIDTRSAENLQTLLLAVRPVFSQLVLAGKKIAAKYGCDYKAIGGTRTYAEQAALYAQGRTKPGNVVTRAKPGFSNHNFGIAIDNGVFRGNEYLDSSEPATAEKIHRELSEWAKKNMPGEIEWGGDWRSFPDTPHFQFKTGLTLAQMRARVAAGRAIV